MVLSLTSKIAQVESELGSRIKKLESALDSLVVKIEELKSDKKAEVASSTSTTWATVVSSNKARGTNVAEAGLTDAERPLIPCEKIDQTNFVIAEKEEREKRKMRLVIFCVKEQTGID